MKRNKFNIRGKNRLLNCLSGDKRSPVRMEENRKQTIERVHNIILLCHIYDDVKSRNNTKIVEGKKRK